MDEVTKPEADPIPAAFKRCAKALEGLTAEQQSRVVRSIAILLDVKIGEPS